MILGGAEFSSERPKALLPGGGGIYPVPGSALFLVMLVLYCDVRLSGSQEK